MNFVLRQVLPAAGRGAAQAAEYAGTFLRRPHNNPMDGRSSFAEAGRNILVTASGKKVGAAPALISGRNRCRLACGIDTTTETLAFAEARSHTARRMFLQYQDNITMQLFVYDYDSHVLIRDATFPDSITTIDVRPGFSAIAVSCAVCPIVPIPIG